MKPGLLVICAIILSFAMAVILVFDVSRCQFARASAMASRARAPRARISRLAASPQPKSPISHSTTERATVTRRQSSLCARWELGTSGKSLVCPGKVRISFPVATSQSLSDLAANKVLGIFETRPPRLIARGEPIRTDQHQHHVTGADLPLEVLPSFDADLDIHEQVFRRKR